MDYLSSVYDNCDFYFCLGADSFIDLVQGKWQQTDRILNELLFNENVNNNTDNSTSRDHRHRYRRRLVVLYRAQTKIVSDQDEATITSHLTSATGSSGYLDHLQKLVDEFGVQLIRMDRSEDNISSTFVRNCSDVSKLRDNPAVLLPEVLQYIQHNKLYQFCQ